MAGASAIQHPIGLCGCRLSRQRLFADIRIAHICVLVSPLSPGGSFVAHASSLSFSFHHFGLFPLLPSSCQQSAFLCPLLPHPLHFPLNFSSPVLSPCFALNHPLPFFQCLLYSTLSAGMLHSSRNSVSIARKNGMSSSQASVDVTRVAMISLETVHSDGSPFIIS